MTNPHYPITPPPELVQQWIAEIWHEGTPVRVAASDLHIATRAAQWGEDQELEACCRLLDNGEHAATYGCHNGNSLRAARRPKPPSLAAEALKLIGSCNDPNNDCLDDDALDTIRRALERLQELEEQQ